MKFGAQTEYGKLRKVLMHRPGEDMKVVTAGNKNDYLFRDPVYWKAFQEEHDTFVDVLKAEGVEVVLLTDLLDERHSRIADALPNLVYTRDVAMVNNLGANILRMTYPARFVEPTLMEKAFNKLGIPIAHRVTPPGLVEGGDFVWFNEKTPMMGFGTRSNEHGVYQMRDSMLGRCVKEFVAQPLPSWRVHLDGALMMMAPDLALFYPGALKLFPFSEAHKVSGYPPGGTPTVGLKEKLRTVIDAETAAMETFFCGGGSRDQLLELRSDEVIRATGAVVTSITR